MRAEKMSADEAWRQAIAKAEILLSEGEAAEDISGIADAVSGFNAALKLAPRAEAPLDWAKTQSRLSAALRALGARIDDPVMLHSAMTACDHALEVYRPRHHAGGLGTHRGAARRRAGGAGRARQRSGLAERGAEQLSPGDRRLYA